MVKINVLYEGNLHTTATHEPSGAQIATDAPKDNEGLGASFSPTDLLATALGSCMATIAGIVARRREVRLEGLRVSVTKHMVAEPVRRVGRLEVILHMPEGIPKEHRKPIEVGALACPVHKSLHPDIEIPVRFEYPDP